MKKLTVLFASALLALVLVAPASAGPVTEWNWQYNGAFAAWADTGSLVGANVTPSDPTLIDGVGILPQTLSWGDGANGPSSINIDPIVDGDLDYEKILTDGPATTVAYMTHNNFTISGDDETLTWGRVATTFSLTPEDPAVWDTEDVYSAELEFLFFETQNNPDGTWTEEYEWLSDDVFILLSTSVTSETFFYNGYEYLFNFEGSYDVIDQAYIDHLVYNLGIPLDPTETYFGWVTAEDAITVFESQVAITHVPEPSTFILLGAGLLGLAGIARRRRS